jgi:hypothetical protein
MIDTQLLRWAWASNGLTVSSSASRGHGGKRFRTFRWARLGLDDGNQVGLVPRHKRPRMAQTTAHRARRLRPSEAEHRQVGGKTYPSPGPANFRREGLRAGAASALDHLQI